MLQTQGTVAITLPTTTNHTILEGAVQIHQTTILQGVREDLILRGTTAAGYLAIDQEVDEVEEEVLQTLLHLLQALRGLVVAHLLDLIGMEIVRRLLTAITSLP